MKIAFCILACVANADLLPSRPQQQPLPAARGCCYSVGFGAFMIECCQTNFVDSSESECTPPGGGFVGGTRRFDPRSCSEVERSFSGSASASVTQPVPVPVPVPAPAPASLYPFFPPTPYVAPAPYVAPFAPIAPAPYVPLYAPVPYVAPYIASASYLPYIAPAPYVVPSYFPNAISPSYIPNYFPNTIPSSYLPNYPPNYFPNAVLPTYLPPTSATPSYFPNTYFPFATSNFNSLQSSCISLGFNYCSVGCVNGPCPTN